MNDYDLALSFLGNKEPKDFEKLGVTKNKAYKINARAEFLKPFVLAILNLSDKEFRAVREGKLKNEIISKKESGGFSPPVENNADDIDDW